MKNENNQLLKPPSTRFKKIYENGVFEEIIERIESGELLSDILKSDLKRFPEYSYFWKYLQANEDAKATYLRAREIQMNYYADEIITRSLNRKNDTITTEVRDKDGNVIRTEKRSDSTAVQRDKLITDNFKFLMARLAASTFSDKQEVKHSGEINHISVTIEQKQRKVQEEIKTIDHEDDSD